MNTISRYGYRSKDFQTGVYGGGRMFGIDNEPRVIDVGDSNVKKTLTLLKEAGFRVQKQDVRGRVYRHVLMDRNTGDVRVKSTEISATMT